MRFSLLTKDESNCVGCDARRKVLMHLPLCESCMQELLTQELSSTNRCGRCLSIMHPEKGCTYCKQAGHEVISKTYAPYPYKGAIRGIIHQLKFRGNRNVAALLTHRMYAEIASEHFDVLVPVPLHQWRKNERGYNQAEVLAYPVSVHSGIPLHDVLQRNRSTKRQTALRSDKARKSNVLGAFQMQKGKASEIEGKHILLVDDVRTTGATAIACANVLLKAGAREVSLLVGAVASHTSSKTKE